MWIEYTCPECGDDLFGDFDENVSCEACGLEFETDWDWEGDEQGVVTWITRRSKISHC